MSVDASKIKSSSFTLRFKHTRTTILLFVEPTTPFATVKALLLEALQEQYPNGLPDDPPTPLPEEISDIILGVPKDADDFSQGWEELSTGGSVKESPKTLGIKDGDVLAFAFTHEEQKGKELFAVEFPDQAELYPEEEPDYPM